MTILGIRKDLTRFQEVAERSGSEQIWGDYDSQQVRGSLKVGTLNRAVDVIYSSRALAKLPV